MIILVIDDDPGVLTAVERMLVARGHDVFTASDTSSASSVLAERGLSPDVLLVDVVLDAENGLDCARTLLTMHSSMRIVFMTGAEHREPGVLRSGLGPVLRKPFDASRLYAAIETTPSRN